MAAARDVEGSWQGQRILRRIDVDGIKWISRMIPGVWSGLRARSPWCASTWKGPIRGPGRVEKGCIGLC